MTRNQKLHVLHVDSAQAFAEGQALQYVPGDTLLFDFVYFLHPVRPALMLVMISCSNTLSTSDLSRSLICPWVFNVVTQAMADLLH